MIAVIFDFNGTLFYDAHLHKIAWGRFGERHGTPISEERFHQDFIGQTNRTVLERLFGRKMPDEEIEALTNEKEQIYRDLCLEEGERFCLAPGAEDFFLALKKRGIPFTIATGSEVNNVNFFFEELKLSRFFDRAKIVYDDGTFEGKPAPDMFLRAAEVLGVPPSDCVVFEDAVSGIRSATAAGVRGVVGMTSDLSAEKMREYPIVKHTAPDYVGMMKKMEELFGC